MGSKKACALVGLFALIAVVVWSIPCFAAPSGTTPGSSSQSELTWLTPVPGASPAELRDEIESQGGRILTLAPEGRLLVRHPRDKTAAVQAAPGVASSHAAVMTAEPPGPAGRGLGDRPPTEEEEYILRAVTQVTQIKPTSLSLRRAMLEGLDTLPSQVDNSLSMYFPPIRSQGSQGSCTAWASSYYYNTYTQAMDEGLDVSGGNNDHICSPAFIYNLINGGADEGASSSYAVFRLTEVGASSWTLFPYNSGDWTTWPTEAAWGDALKRRGQAPFTIGHWYLGCSDAELEAIKQHLANGHVAATRTDVYENWYYNYPSDTTGINNGVLFANGGGRVGGHALTLVGYDDNKSYFDGAVTRYGAFLIANSWGSWWGVPNTAGGTSEGFMWVAYDFFKAGNSCFGTAYYNSDRDDYRSRLYAVSGLNHAQRGYVSYRSGVGETGSPAWTSYYPMSNAGGTALAITDARRVAVDLTDGIDSISFPTVRLFTQLTLSGSAGSDATITSAVFFHDFDGNGAFDSVASSDPTVVVGPGGTGYATVVFDVPLAFKVMDPRGRTLAAISSSGDLELAGSITEYAVPTPTAGSEFIVREPSGTAVALLDASGNLILAGGLYEDQSPLSPPAGSFVVKDSAGDIVAYFSPTGDLYLAGELQAGP